MEYVMILNSNGFFYSESEKNKMIGDFRKWMEKYTNRGNYIFGSPFKREGVKIESQGKHLDDGDFLWGKNLLTGYIRLQAESLEEAAKIADECPLLIFNEITVMPIYDMM